MRKKLILIMACVLMFICLFTGCSQGFVKEDFYHQLVGSKNTQIISIDKSDTTEKIKQDLQEKLGYNGKLTEEIKINTYIKITEVQANKDKDKIKYQVQFGESGDPISYNGEKNNEFTLKELQEIFGLDTNVSSNDLKVGYNWEANIIARCRRIHENNHEVSFMISLEKLYTGADLDKINDQKTSDKEVEAIAADLSEDIENGVNGVLDAVDTLAHLPELIVSKIAGLILGLGDAIQAGANAIPSLIDSVGNQNSLSASEISDAKEVLHSYDELKSNADKGNNLDKYTKVSEYKGGEAVVKRIEVPEDCDGNKKESFTKDTYIPVISGDLYNIAVDHIDFFDINFLTGGKEKKSDGKGLKHAENSNWSNFTKFASTVIRISIYIASSILIVSIIYSGFNIVKNTLDNPQARAKEKERLEKIKNAVVMIVGSVMVMALCIYASKGLFSGIAKTDSYEMPIRVDVENLYSFSTSATGYVRYMASTTDLEECGQRIKNAAIYLGLVICNALAICTMVVRMIAVWLLSMIGPFIAILYVFDKKDFSAFVTWVKAYSAMALFPPIFIRIIYTIILG